MLEIGRNDPCPCGSGKKYKQCCLLKKSSSASRKLWVWLLDKRPEWFTLITFAFIILVATAAYYNSFTVPFVFDDGSNIVHNKGVHLSSLRVEDGDIVRLKAVIDKNGRAVSQISYALNYYFGRLEVFGYHLFNLIIHILCAWAVFLFTKMTLTLPSMKDRYGGWAKEIAAACAIIFVVHPINTQAVTYIVQRATSLAALFTLICMIYYAKGRLACGGRRFTYYVISFVCFLIAFSSKQNTVVVPILIFIYELYFFQQVDTKWLKKKWPYIGGLALFLFLVLLIYTKFAPIAWFESHYAHRPFSLWERVMTEWRVVVYYFTLIFLPLPSRLNLDYDFPLSLSLINPPTTILSLAVILGLIWLALYLAKKEPLISYFILWFFINLVVESTIVALDLVYEHRLYLPGIGAFIIIIWGLERAIHHLAPRLRTPLKVIMLAILTINLSMMTYQRNKVWQSVISILEDVAKKAPTNARQHVNLGVAYSDAKMLDKSIKQYLIGIKLDPNYPEAYNNLGNAYNRKGMYDKAVKEYLRAIRMRPTYKEAHNNLGSAYCNMGKFDMAIQEHLTALKINPDCEKSHNNLGVAYSFKREYDNAIAAYKRALEINPLFIKARTNLGLAYGLKGEPDNAVTEYKKVLQLKPYDLATNYNLGNIYNQKGQSELAIKYFGVVVAQNPNHAEANSNLGLAYKRLKNYQKAEEFFKRAISLKGNIPEFHFNLGLVYKDTKRLKEAKESFNRAIQLKRNFAVAYYNLGLIAEDEKNFKLAADKYQQSIRANQRFAMAYNRLGLILLNHSRNTKEALRIFERSLVVSPNQPDAAQIKNLINQLKGKRG